MLQNAVLFIRLKKPPWDVYIRSFRLAIAYVKQSEMILKFHMQLTSINIKFCPTKS